MSILHRQIKYNVQLHFSLHWCHSDFENTIQTSQGSVHPSRGTLIGGHKCRMLNLRNDNVHCHYFCNFPVSLNKIQYPKSNLSSGLFVILTSLICYLNITRRYIIYSVSILINGNTPI